MVSPFFLRRFMTVEIYTDGSSRGNPGPGGYGCVLLYTDPQGQVHRREFSQGYRMTTNNRMEMMAVIVGLEALIRPCRVIIHSDSQYIVNAFNQHWIDGWKKKNWKRGKDLVKNKDLWLRMLAAMEMHEVTFEWVKGHAGNPENERCDDLAVAAAGSDSLAEDENYESES